MTQAKIPKRSLNPIPSSMRGKKRYVLFELRSRGSLTKNLVESAIYSTFLREYGSIGVGRQKLRLVLFNPESGKGIVRCSLECLTEVKVGILFVQEVGQEKVVPRVIRVSGSMRKLKEFVSEPKAKA